jgi:16S rRNA (cytosine1402-N4)-methyltransferase
MAVAVRRKQKREGEKPRHPATVPFQAIRIAVNEEFSALDTFLNTALDLLFPKGRLAVISFHSLEDQIVARKMRSWSQNRPTPLRLPTMAGVQGFGRLLTGKAITASVEELRENPRARSARLRVFERGEGEAWPTRRAG